jgi:hypothetical protein
MELSPSWEANGSSATQGIPKVLSRQSATCPYREPDRSCLYRRISPVPSLLCLVRNMVKFLRWGIVRTSPNPKAESPPLVGCPRLLIQYIRSYRSLSGVRSSIRKLRTRPAMVTGTHLSLDINFELSTLIWLCSARLWRLWLHIIFTWLSTTWRKVLPYLQRDPHNRLTRRYNTDTKESLFTAPNISKVTWML